MANIAQNALHGQRDLDLRSRHGPQCGQRVRLHLGGSFGCLRGNPRARACGSKEPPPQLTRSTDSGTSPVIRPHHHCPTQEAARSPGLKREPQAHTDCSIVTGQERRAFATRRSSLGRRASAPRSKVQELTLPSGQPRRATTTRGPRIARMSGTMYRSVWRDRAE